MTVRAHPLCIGAWSLCFHAIFSGYANIVQYSGITIQYNCILHTRSSLHISVSNLAYLHCISFSTTFFFKPKIVLVNNQRVLNPNNHNIFKCDIPSMVSGLQGPWNDTGCNMNVFPPGMSSVAVSWVAPHTLQVVLPNRFNVASFIKTINYMKLEKIYLWIISFAIPLGSVANNIEARTCLRPYSSTQVRWSNNKV